MFNPDYISYLLSVYLHKYRHVYSKHIPAHTPAHTPPHTRTRPSQQFLFSVTIECLFIYDHVVNSTAPVSQLLTPKRQWPRVRL